MKLLGSTRNKITKDKNGENVPHLKITNCISKTNNTQIDNAEYIDIVLPMYNLIEYSDNCSETFGSLWQYCKEIPALNNNGNIVDFDEAIATNSFNFKTKITGQTNNNGIVNVE